MLIINSRRGTTAGGLRRYGGGDVFSSIGRSGMKRIINKAANSSAAQKIANAVVDGAHQGVVKVVEDAKEFVTNKLKQIRKRPSTSKQESKTPTKREKIDINQFVDGSGIILD